MDVTKKIGYWLIIIAAVNLGLIGIVGFDLVGQLGDGFVRIFNILVGLSAVLLVFSNK